MVNYKAKNYRKFETMEKGKYLVREELDTVAMEPLSPMSQLLSSPGMFIVVTFGSQIRFNLSAIVEGIKNTLINAPRFSSKMVNHIFYTDAYTLKVGVMTKMF